MEKSKPDQKRPAKRTIYYIPRAKECQCSTHIRYNFQSSSIADSEKVHRLQIGTVAPIVLTGALHVLILRQAVEMAALCIS